MEDEEKLMQKYRISKSTMQDIKAHFGTMDNFRKAYIQYLIDLSNATTLEERQTIDYTNRNVLEYKYQGLRLIKDFDLCGNQAYRSLVYKILGYEPNRYQRLIGKQQSLVLGPDIGDGLELAIKKTLEQEELSDEEVEERRAIILGIDRKDKSSKFELNQKRQYWSDMHAVAKNWNEQGVYVATEDFIKAYFEKHGIFREQDEPAISDEDIKKLIRICKEQTTKAQDQERKLLQQVGVTDLFELFDEDTNWQLRNTGIYTISQLLEVRRRQVIKK